MSRSFVLSSLFAFACCMASGHAQEDRSDLQNAAARVDERLQRLDHYLQRLQSGEAQQHKERAALQELEKELMSLRELVKAQEKSLQRTKAEQQQAADQKRDAERRLAEAQQQQRRAHDELEADHQRMRAEQQKLIARLQLAAQKEEETTRAAADKATAQLREQLEQERQKARAQQKELAQLREQATPKAVFHDTDGDGLPDARLPQERGAAPPPALPAGFVIHNENCEVHLHFHGGAVPPPTAGPGAVKVLSGGAKAAPVPDETPARKTRKAPKEAKDKAPEPAGTVN